MGLVDELVEPGAEGTDAVLDRAIERAAELAAGAVAAQAMAKWVIDAGLDGMLEDGLTLEQDRFVEVFRTDDAVAGVRSFLEHGPGKATFTGR
jgi:enoyl-CoA hydratase/carnithine racemase